jgi:hypothetical protein
MKKLSSWILVGILVLGIVFLALDNCGNTDKYNKLKGEYETYSTISKIIIKESIQAIDVQNDEIGILAKKITYLHGIIEVKDEDLADKEEELGELKRDFADLEECQAQYDKLVEAFSLAKGIIKELGKPIKYYDEHGNRKFRYPEGTVTFNLNEKYEKQIKISTSYKTMYESEHTLRLSGERVIGEGDKALKKIRLFSKAKTGIVVGLSLLILYNMVK